ncbi:MAG: YggT family protein [Alphaproteobacteria bacterium GM7ARS4]|nr:YggT family protein [Alphaproteobacteria bacterium GM7ARS4]
MIALFNLLDNILSAITWIVILSVILNWLITFGFVSGSNRLIYGIADVCERVSSFLLYPIQRIVPRINGIDISPMILILFIIFLRDIIATNMPLTHP